MQSRLGPLTLTVLLGLAGGAAAAAETALPRKSPPESYPGVVVLYDSVTDAAGHRLRLILTHPQERAPLPVIFVAGWLSCDTVEAPAGDRGAAQHVFQALATLPGFATMRLDKAGVGDSEGDCARSDFNAELEGYRSAFRRLGDYAFIDKSRIFVFGLSNGAGFAPLVADGAPVRGYVVVGGWIKTWFEHMLEIERRRLALAGKPAADINALMREEEQLYSAYLLRGEAPADIFRAHPELRMFWEGDPAQQYGRPVAYYQQLQQLNLMAAWAAVKVPLLALHGEYDWIMSRADLEIMVALVNRNSPGSAEFMELPATGHTFEHYPSQQAAYAGEAQPFDPAIAERVSAWFVRHR